ncbi:hypothetical protein SPRG_00527 [Saprolegnia parasitica CBS 223.65]|uniref:RING-type domain-containing protein n=1 Tax=Saprolegnia parasitica (strain CBS 223.65) TaxID=695850 RepID=A0A067CVA9_SAPPC|nr:hypothetical protein SPRG_00527 [Saprolegnia parasitica CBS 223.65]KDO34463.1 hypothetical protein SPRG_00527 [Saprolegnia parasitica CBS 223.65]|eukprot:XP_012194144.1 hypothetical protein SPRG_00527 [Saprolegnia parasitica CBS 223.65]
MSQLAEDDDVVVVGARPAPPSDDDDILVTDAAGNPIVIMRPIVASSGRRNRGRRRPPPPPAVANADVIELLSDNEDANPRIVLDPQAQARANALEENRKRERIVETAKAKMRCPLCLDPYEEMASTTCGHVYCKECITLVVAKIHKCPLCQRKLATRDIHAIFV